MLGLLAAVGRISHSPAILRRLKHIKSDPIVSSAGDKRHCDWENGLGSKELNRRADGRMKAGACALQASTVNVPGPSAYDELRSPTSASRKLRKEFGMRREFVGVVRCSGSRNHLKARKILRGEARWLKM